MRGRHRKTPGDGVGPLESYETKSVLLAGGVYGVPCACGGSEQQRDLFPEPEAAVYGFRVLQGPAVADADAVEHGGAGMLRRLRYPQASALDHLERADR